MSSARVPQPATRTTSIIIRTKDEQRWLGQTLDAVFAQRTPPDEVIVIDSGSTDGTLGIARSRPVRLLEIRPEEWSYSRSLNRAAAAATGDILVILSAHCIPIDRDWLGNLLRHFDAPDIAGVWGPSVRLGRPRPEPGPCVLQRPGTYDYEHRTWGLSNPNAAIRRCLWEEFAFDEALPAAEDKAWGREAMARGFSIAHDPTAAVWHPPHPPLSAYRRGRAVAAGFAMMFPEETPPSRPVLDLVRALVRSAGFHFRNRELRSLAQDLRRLPSTVFAVCGSVIGTRGKHSR